MIEISNIQIQNDESDWIKLICDLNIIGGGTVPFEERKIWIAVEEKNRDMLTDESYDPFVLIPLMIGMYYGHDVHIKGKISPRFYHNIQHYIINIFDRFSDIMKPVNFTVDGFTVVEGPHNLIGTSISCGTDCMTTIYDNYVLEEDENFKINSLFFFNYGSHGDFDDGRSHNLYMERVKLNKECADALGLPMYLVDSNFHAFTHLIGEQQLGYCAQYSCVLGLQKYIKRYLTPSALNYDEILENRENTRNFDFAEYCESWFNHLVSTEHFELVIDGCQYSRGEKTEHISEWNIAHKYLNVCIHPIDGAHNCSNCSKCMRTLVLLEAMGKTDMFSDVFDLDVYKRENKRWKSKFALKYGKDSLVTSLVDYAKDRGLRFPSKVEAVAILGARKIKRKFGNRK